MRDILNKTIWATLIMGMGMMLYVIWLIIWPIEAMHVNVQPSIILTPEVRAGETVSFELDYCRFTNVPSTLSRSIRGDNVYHLEPFTTVGKKGCREMVVSVVLPEDITVGTYYILTVNETQVNPLHRIVTPFETQPFTVIK